MRVREIMTRDVATCGPGDTLARAAQLMWERDCGAIPVIGPRREVLGIVTDRDVCMAAHFHGQRLAEIRVGDAMARDVHVCGPLDSVESAEAILRENRVRRLPVVDEHQRLIAIVSIADIVRHLDGKSAPPLHAQPLLVETIAKISEPRHAS